jgi:hypothetical protein
MAGWPFEKIFMPEHIVRGLIWPSARQNRLGKAVRWRSQPEMPHDSPEPSFSSSKPEFWERSAMRVQR